MGCMHAIDIEVSRWGIGFQNHCIVQITTMPSRHPQFENGIHLSELVVLLLQE